MKLFKTLEKQLCQENNYVTDDGELKKWVVIHKAQHFDADLLALLLEHDELKQRFFVDVKGTLVFKQNDFIDFLEQKNYLNDSYTQYKNKIGLSIGGKFLKQRNEVALVWPFKDCVLEGGQSKEEDKREEIFFNQILAQDEITQLLEPKVLSNAKVYNKEGEQPFKGFTRDAQINKKRGLPEDTITDNLVIKGNNLLALHSLKKEFAGKVNLIYIDPPYNTGSDSFGYNDNFSNSTWLSFMRTRLEVAKTLLSDKGSIWINIDDNGSHYLKVLCDEVFTQNCYVASIAWQKFHSVKSNAEYNISKSHDNIIVYVKESNSLKFNKLPMSKEALKVYKNPDNDDRGKWRTAPLTVSLLGGARGASYAKTGVSNGLYEIIAPNGKAHSPASGRCWFSKKKIESLIEDNRVWWGKDGTATPMEKIFLNEKGGKKTASTFWNHKEFGSNKKANDEMKELFPDNLGSRLNFSTPKPEQLINKIIDLSTNKNDIVLDFFVGSGTTAAVSKKMQRQFIAIEQMDYIEQITIKRLKKVIAGEQGGISQSVNWQGGGSFTYFELKKYNQLFMEQIEGAKNTAELLKIWQAMKDKSFLNYNVDIKKQEQHMDDFKALSLKQQKQHLAEILDKNQLYVNLSSLDDKDFACSAEEKTLTKAFYHD